MPHPATTPAQRPTRAGGAVVAPVRLRTTCRARGPLAGLSVAVRGHRCGSRHPVPRTA